MKMNHVTGALVAAWTLGGMLCTSEAAKPKTQPNILFVFADDLCFDTINALGNTEIHTPNLDRLVKRGMSFSHAYNMGSWSGAVCVASRAMLNTGRFLWQAQKAPKQLKPKGRMWSQRMQAAGYDTYMAGKWHVPVPADDIFNTTGAVRPGMPNQTKAGYHRPTSPDDKAWLPWDTSRDGFWKGGKHWSEVLGDETVGFLEKAKDSDKPFFVYAAFNAPHDPRQSPKAFVDMYPLDKIAVPPNYLSEYPYKDSIGCSAGLRDEALAPFPRTEHAVKVHRQEYYAIISHLDTQVGRMLDALDASGKADNTYIFFTADHGLAVGQHGLLGKQNMYDHSVRVPFIVCGPDIKAGSHSDTPIYLQDIVPTTLELAGTDTDGVAFKSLNPLIAGKKDPHYAAIYGAYLNVQRMITKDGFKLIYYPKAKIYRLYNLENDPHEKDDLADNPKHGAKLAMMKEALLALQKDMGDPLVAKQNDAL